MENSQSLKKRKSFRRWIKKVTAPKITPLITRSTDGKQGVFGIPLVVSICYARATIGYQDANQVNHQRAAAIPLVVAKCGSFLKRNGLGTEGIFRLSGSTKRVNTLQQIFDSPEQSYGLHHTWKDYSVHDAGSILRRYFLQLPDPVIPTHFYQRFRDVMNDSMYEGTSQRIDAFQHLICQLQTAHQHLLLYVLDMLRLFATNASSNRMDASNLAAVFSPGLLSHPQHNSPVQYMISQRVIEFLIEYQALFTMDLLVDNEAKPVDPDDSLVSPNILDQLSSQILTPSPTSTSRSTPTPTPTPTRTRTRTRTLTSSRSAQTTKDSRSSCQPPVPPLPSHYISQPHSLPQSPQTPETQLDEQQEQISDCHELVTISSDYQSNKDVEYHTSTPRPSTPSQQKKADSIFGNTMTHTITRAASISKTQLNMTLNHIVYWWKYTFNPLLLIWYTMASGVTSTVLYECFLIYNNTAIVEPFFFFSGFFVFWCLLIFGTEITPLQIQEKVQDHGSLHSANNDEDVGTILSYQLENDFSDHDDGFDRRTLGSQCDGDGYSLFDDISVIGDRATEQSIMQDKSVMANWQQLMTRSWRAAPDDMRNELHGRQQQMYPALGTNDSSNPFVDDRASMASVSSRFNEHLSASDDDGDDENDELASTTEEDLEQLWERYEQFKKDEELAEKLQHEEEMYSLTLKQQQHNGYNPFLDHDSSN